MFETKDASSTRPYMIRALYEWCTDNGYTPFIAVLVNEQVRVPMEFVKDGEIVLNISFDATSALNLGNEFIEFKGRFGGVARDIVVPIERVLAIYARENGQGMAFPMLASTTPSESDGVISHPRVIPVESDGQPVSSDSGPGNKPTGGGRAALTRVK